MPQNDFAHRSHVDLICNGGEMGLLIRAYNWTATPLGPVETWPNALLTVLRVLLSSRYAMWLAWGPDLTFFCNDAYRPTLGDKRDWALGASARRVWAEIWPDIGPRIDSVLQTGQATWDDGLLLFLERSGYPEETYHTFSYSPAPDDAGGVGGMLCVVAEETERVLGERRLATLVSLAAALAGAQDEEGVWRAAREGIGSNAKDLPFTVAFMAGNKPGSIERAASTGIDRPFAEDAAWPSLQALASGPVLIPDLAALAGSAGVVPTGLVWGVPPRQALVLPITWPGTEQAAGFFVAGLNPFRRLDDAYQDFLRLVVGQIAAGLATARSLAEERRRAEALAELDRTKTAFFSNVSHEFRTPLTLMLAPIEDALAERSDARLAPVQHSRLETAHRNSLRLLKLVNTLLDFSRLEAGRLVAVYQATDLAALTAEIAAGFRSAIERAGLRFQVDVTPLAEPVYVDPDMWERVVLNLLSNAFKFTFEGGITVTFGPGDEGVALTVSDTGVGIPEHELPRLFERFHRIEGQRSRSFEGSGIGLALSDELVRLHGGRIAASSLPGVGTRLVVTVPTGRSHLATASVAEQPISGRRENRAAAFIEEAMRWRPDTASTDGPTPDTGAPSCVGPRPSIVVADDNADMLDYMRSLLGDRYSVVAVPDGAAALAAIRRSPPDLVLSDVMMPELDGFGLLREIRADSALRALPVILLSARAGEEARTEGLDSGADDYLAKPFSARELLARVGSNIAMARVRQATGDALRQRTAELETVMATVPVGVWFTSDPEGRTVQANAAAAQLLRMQATTRKTLTAAPLTGGTAHYRVTRSGREIPPAELPLHRALRGGKVVDEDLDIEFDDGSTVSLLVQARPFLGPDGTIAGAICSATDVSELRAAEEAARALNLELEARIEDRTRDLVEANERLLAEIAERSRIEDDLRQSQKMEAVGQLTGGIAHDFNNLLTGISGSLELLQTRAAQGRVNDLSRYIAAARGAAERAAALTHRLLAFSRRQTLEPKVVNANRLVAGMEELIRRTIGPSIQLEFVKAAGHWLTLCDPNQLENVLLNLCINARDAMPDGGRLTIETENAFLDANSARARDIAPGQYVGVHVTDTGVGMPKEVASRAFDPFFTTKPIGQGTGLGLSMTYGFARQSGGQVRIYSEVGQGTSIKLYLPRHHGSESIETEAAADVTASANAQAGETVLVVDDEPTVRMLVAEILADLGYTAIEAEDGPGGLRFLEADRRIDLLVTDVGLPGGMNGRQLADAARVRRPDLKVLFITGYAENAVFGNGLLEPGMQVIAKPFAMEVLATRIRVMISGS